MDVLIGVDEAGYGPNYGPLAVAATAWAVGSEERGARSEGPGRRGLGSGRAVTSSTTAAPACHVDLYKLLRKAVCRTPDKAGRKLAIADSKVLYSPQLGLRQLERGVLAALGAMGAKPQAIDAKPQAAVTLVAELLAATCADPERRRHELACHADDELALPLEALVDEIVRLAERLHAACRDGGVTLVAMRARLVYPAEFNALVERWGSKGAALSHVTMALVRGVVDEVTAGHVDGAKPSATADLRQAADRAPCSVRIFFDKHGGRSRYAGLVQHHFADSWIETIAEERRSSRYRWMHGETPVEAEFRVGCEELLPTALASMTAKYHREVAMRAFNAFWTSRVPGLRPTAGYPGDATRFRTDIAAVQAELGIADAVLWRCR
jgi:hypothetical protein